MERMLIFQRIAEILDGAWRDSIKSRGSAIFALLKSVQKSNQILSS